MIKLDFDSAIAKACELATQTLKANHVWIDRTGQMTGKIGFTKVGEGEYDIVIDVPYATYVNCHKAYLDEFEAKVRVMVMAYLEQLTNE